MKLKRIEKKEIQKIILDMAKVVHGILEKNDIPYFMLGGSILGAVRHKGFIPWDDDFDIGVPREYWEKMIRALDADLPVGYRFVDYKRAECHILGTAKIEYTNSKVHEPIYREYSEKDKLGLTLDIFPLDRISLPFKGYKKIRLLQRLQFLLFSKSKNDTTNKKICRVILRFILRTICGIKKTALPQKIDAIANKNSDPNGEWFLSTWSHYYMNVARVDVYGKPQKYAFEDTFFYGPEKADDYLKALFGDYMKLPPREKQIYHSEETFIIQEEK